MKKIILLISAAFLLTSGNALHAREYAPLPIHPLSVYYSYQDPNSSGTRILADSISYTEQSYLLEGLPAGGGYATYKRSPDGLTDTIYTGYGLLNMWIYEYSPNGKLLSMKETYRPNSAEEGSYVKLVYDKQERLIADTTFFDRKKSGFTTYTYLQDTVLIHYTSIEYPGDFWKKQITYHYTDSGYIQKEIRESVNSNGTVSIDTTEREYVFDASNRLIRANNNIHYTYSEDGGYMENHETISYRQNRYYNNKGYYIKQDSYRKENGEWVLSVTYSVEYHYNPGNPNHNVLVESQHLQAYGIEGTIRIQAGQPEWVSVYSIAGQLVHRQYVPENATFYLPKGLYIVTAGKESQKVMVR